jgi:dTDP-4-dehydrorhamnose reductase
MRVVITGANGQLGRALQQAFRGDELFLIDLPQHDVTDPGIVATVAELEPDLVIHAAAMTDVDGCERDPDLAFRVNEVGTRAVAEACRLCDADLLYVSTDYVFDGSKGEPYLESDEPNPVCVYGRSKLAGEIVVRDLLTRYYIVRTAWLYGPSGSNFVTKILELAADRGELSIVTTEVGSPTYAPDLAAAIASLTQHPLYGIYHLVNEGSCSRFEFAERILELAGKTHVAVEGAQHYERLATVPANAALRNLVASTQLGITLRPWQEALRAYFEDLNS